MIVDMGNLTVMEILMSLSGLHSYHHYHHHHHYFQCCLDMAELGVQPEPISRISILLATGTDLGVGMGPSMGLESRSRAFVQPESPCLLLWLRREEH